MAYTNPNFKDNRTPALSAENMNNLANAVAQLTTENGGTGRTSLTTGAILYGDGTNPVGQLVGTGAVYATVSGSPQFGTLPVSCGGTGVTSLDALKSNMGLANAGFVVQSSAPSNTSVLWINSDNSTLNYYNGSDWIAIRGVFA
jgi:hypothetical protein